MTNRADLSATTAVPEISAGASAAGIFIPAGITHTTGIARAGAGIFVCAVASSTTAAIPFISAGAITAGISIPAGITHTTGIARTGTTINISRTATAKQLAGVPGTLDPRSRATRFCIAQ